ncbi:MAG: FtsX-like permease family protein [Oscillospiraceae bacterium]|nr:FtsX-like permease family protein [Oscillospiraceae bacterium]
MYLRILKKDLKRKKTMNVILLIFVILAATFIASSANNLTTVSSALDNFFEKAEVPDYWFASTNDADVERFEDFAEENGYDYSISRLIQIEPRNILAEGEKLEYSNTMCLSTLGGIKIFDKNNEEITHINDGELYVTNHIFNSTDNDFHVGGKIFISQNGVEKEFTIKGYTKDALFGTAMVGMSRFLISDNDAALFDNENEAVCSSVEVHTDDADYLDKFNMLGLNTIMAIDRSMFKMTYLMEILIAGILLVVSVCLILISMVILRFIINFTITEEFREIGVMKAIGIKNFAIRGLYIAKYFAIAVIGTAVGLGLSFPLSRLMITGVSQKIVISSGDNFPINIGAAILACAVVVLFSYLCTRKIRKFSPIDAIRSGETGERYKKKGILRLGKSHMPTVPFMALNDIFSGFKSYVSMIIIFILGTLLVIIPVNTINTLRSDRLITIFNMVESDHVISQELLFNPNEDNKAMVERKFAEVREMFAENGIDVDVFQEIMFRSNISKGEKRTNSISFQGMGGVTADMYTYLEGTPPQNVHEVALTHLTAGQIDAHIGDDVDIKIGNDTRTYTVTAINQSMNNMGEGVRFYQDAELDYNYAAGSFGIQVNYKDDPDKSALAERKELLKKLYPDAKVYTPGEYIGYMIGNVADQLDGMKILILSIILGINALVAMLMVKSFITKEKSEIALLKAMGFKNNALTLWQTLRIGIVLLVSVLTGALLSSPLSPLIITPIFRMLGAYSIEYEIRAAEVYVALPLIMLGVTALAAFISAQGLRKISSSQISNNE